jgi:hypothetical protein
MQNNLLVKKIVSNHEVDKLLEEVKERGRERVYDFYFIYILYHFILLKLS